MIYDYDQKMVKYGRVVVVERKSIAFGLLQQFSLILVKFMATLKLLLGSK